MAKLFFEEEIDPDKLWNLFCYKLSEFPRFRYDVSHPPS